MQNYFFKNLRTDGVSDFGNWQRTCVRFWNYFLHYIIQIIFIVFNIYSVDEGDLQRDEVAISEVIVENRYGPIWMETRTKKV